MSALQITTIPVTPDATQGRAAFVAQANKFGDDLTPFANQINAVAVQVNDNAVAANDAKAASEQAQGLAEAARDAAISASTMVAADYNPNSHPYSKNDLAWGDAGDLYRCILSYTSTATPPAEDTEHWARVNLTPADVDARLDALLDVPSVPKSAPHTLALIDRGQGVDTTDDVTIPPDGEAEFPLGATVVITNIDSSPINIIAGAGVTLRFAGTTSVGDRVLSGYGQCVPRKIGVDTWIISGMGLS